MQLRKLRKIIEGYCPDMKHYRMTNRDTYLAIGSDLVHNLIQVDIGSLELKSYFVSKSSSDNLLLTWDKLASLIESGEMKEILEQDDEIETPLQVFFVEGGELKESSTDCYGWPNLTIEGYEMYDNVHFKSRATALSNGIEELEARYVSWKERKEDQIKKLEETKDFMKILSAKIWNLKNIDKK